MSLSLIIAEFFSEKFVVVREPEGWRCPICASVKKTTSSLHKHLVACGTPNTVTAGM